MLGPDGDFLRAEKRVAQVHRCCERSVAAGIGDRSLMPRLFPAGIIDPGYSGTHHADQARPIHLRSPFQLARARVAQPRNVGKHEDVADFIEPPTTSPAKHLEQFVRLDMSLEVSRLIPGVGDEDRAHRKINAGRKTHGRDDDIELAGFRQRLDQSSAHSVTQPAVLIGDAGAQ